MKEVHEETRLELDLLKEEINSGGGEGGGSGGAVDGIKVRTFRSIIGLNSIIILEYYGILGIILFLNKFINKFILDYIRM